MNISIHRALISGALLALACETGSSAPAPDASAPTASRPAVIYVTDFHLAAAQIESRGLLGRERRGILGRRPGILMRNEEPEDRTQEFVGMLSDSIVKRLKNAGLNAQYLPNVQAQYVPPETQGRIQFAPGTPPLPTAGWLVTGWFEEVAEGQAAVQATVGFGAGSGKAEAAVAVSDLATDAGQPFMVLGSGSRTRRMPGGLITKNPYVMAAKFVLDRRNGTEKDIRSLGANIANGIINYLKKPAGEN